MFYKKLSLSDQYIRNVRFLLIYVRKEEKQFLSHLKTDVKDYCSSHPAADMQELYESFGTPQQLISDYYTEISPDKLISSYRRNRFFSCLLTTVTILIAAAALTFLVYLYIDHLRVKIATPVKIETTIY